MPQQVAYFPLGGGLDLVTPAIAAKPGTARAALNYESDLAGYRRIFGYERYDGRTSPTDAYNAAADATAGAIARDAARAAIQAVPGSGDVRGVWWYNGALYAFRDTTTNFLVNGDGTSTVGWSDQSIPFGGASGSGVLTATGGKLRVALGSGVGASVFGQKVNVVPGVLYTLTFDKPTFTDTFANIIVGSSAGSYDLYNNTGTYPGSGPYSVTFTPTTDFIWVNIGNNFSGGTGYVEFDNITLTAAFGGMYKSTAGGWSAVSLGYRLPFTSGGVYEFAEGDVITGATSGFTATVRRVVVTSGGYDAGDAAGYLIISGASGAFVAENLNVGGNLNVASIATDKIANQLLSGGHYRFVNYNFFGSTGTLRMYGVNGVGKAFEFDGTYFTPITTGMATDAPAHIAAHKKSLFLGFPGGSLQASSLGDPLSWNAITGAAELALGDEITGLVSAAPQSLIVLAKNSVAALYGNDASDWQLETLTNEAGALANTGEKLGSVIYMDNRGVRNVSTTSAYGDFRMGTMTQMVAPLIRAKLNAGQTPIATVRVRTRDIYRVFFADGTGFSIYMGKKVPEVMPLDLAIAVTCACSVEAENSVEKMWFGSTNGFVYQLDKGRSFDGGSLSYHLRLPFNHHGMPHTVKRWHRAAIEYDADGNASLLVTGEVNYADPNEPTLGEQTTPLYGGGGFWDAVSWDEFYWSAPVEGKQKVYIDGVGESMSLLLGGEASDEEPHTLQGLTLFYSVRGMSR